MASLRTAEMQNKYKEYQKTETPGVCGLCSNFISLKEFNYWRIINDMFPWDRIAKVHHMLIPKRHTTGDELTAEEKDELSAIKKGYANDNYELIAEATQKQKTIPAHFHLHLIVPKEEEVV